MLYILYLFFLIYCLTLKFVKSRPLLVISFPSIFPLFPHPISNYDFVISWNSPDPAGVLPFKAISSSLNCKLPSSSPTFCTPLLKSPRNASYLVTIPYTALPKKIIFQSTIKSLILNKNKNYLFRFFIFEKKYAIYYNWNSATAV